jgi:hypothetical protein
MNFGLFMYELPASFQVNCSASDSLRAIVTGSKHWGENNSRGRETQRKYDSEQGAMMVI